MRFQPHFSIAAPYARPRPTTILSRGSQASRRVSRSCPFPFHRCFNIPQKSTSRLRHSTQAKSNFIQTNHRCWYGFCCTTGLTAVLFTQARDACHCREVWLSGCIHGCKKRHHPATDIVLLAVDFRCGGNGSMGLLSFRKKGEIKRRFPCP